MLRIRVNADASTGKLVIVRPEEHQALYAELHDPEVLRFRSKRYVVSRPFGRERPSYPKHLPVRWTRAEADGPAALRQMTVGIADDVQRAQELGLLEAIELRLRCRGLCEEDGVQAAWRWPCVTETCQQRGDGG